MEDRECGSYLYLIVSLGKERKGVGVKEVWRLMSLS